MEPVKSILSWKDVRAKLDGFPYSRPYGVPRGGAILAALTGRNVDDPRDADCIMDDVVDSGATKARYKALHPNLPFWAMIDKSKFPGWGWIVFPWEVRDTVADLSDAIIRLLEGIGENPNRDGLKDTPKRVIKAWQEMTKGMKTDPLAILDKNFIVGDVQEPVSRYDQIILSREIPFNSACEHHMMPFFGVAHVAYIPADHGRVVGLSKLARLVEAFASRLQVQERLTQQIADAIQTKLEPAGAAVILKAKHTCQCFRGIRKDGLMVTSAMHGAFRDSEKTREELFNLIRL